MAKARATPAELDALARPVLLAAVEGEVKLIGPGEPAALLPSKAGANKPVYEHLTAADRPLVTVSKEGKAEFARLTPAGFLLVMPHLPAERVGELARRHADRLPPAERLPFLLSASQASSGDSAAFLAAAVDVLQAEAQAQAEATARRREAEAAILDRLIALKRADIARLGTELTEAQAFVHRLTGDTPPPPVIDLPPSPPLRPAAEPPREPLAPSDSEDLPFRRQVLQRLATAWLEAVEHKRDEGRRYLEAAIHNLRGVRRIGAADETVPFRGAVHRARRPVADGEPVRVTRPGWELDEDDGTFLILPAEVA